MSSVIDFVSCQLDKTFDRLEKTPSDTIPIEPEAFSNPLEFEDSTLENTVQYAFS